MFAKNTRTARNKEISKKTSLTRKLTYFYFLNAENGKTESAESLHQPQNWYSSGIHFQIAIASVDECEPHMSPVCPSLLEPMPGWVDSLNGPVGVMLGAGKGVIRSMLCDGTLTAQVIPVDTAINAIIAIGMFEGARTEK